MAPALTTEPLSPKEKLTSTASPAATRQSSRKLESPAASESPTAVLGSKKSSTPTPAISTRVTRSKDAAKRSAASPVQPNNKRRTINNNNNNNSPSTSLKQSDDQMGLSAASTHNTNTSVESSTNVAINSDCSAATGPSAIPSPIVASPSVDEATDAAGKITVDQTGLTLGAPAEASGEHNNNCKDNSAAELLANLTNDFEEAITAEICLRKTLPDVNLSKEPPPPTPTAVETDLSTSPAEDAHLLLAAVATNIDNAQSTSTAAAAATAAASASATSAAVDVAGDKAINQQQVPPQDVQQQQQQQSQPEEEQLMPTEPLPIVQQRTEAPSSSSNIVTVSEVDQNIEERLRQFKAGAPLPTTPGKAEQQHEQLTAVLSSPSTQQLVAILSSPSLQMQPQQSASPSLQQQQGAGLRPLATQQVTPPNAPVSNVMNFLKDTPTSNVLEDPDIEEVLKALKTLDGNHGNTDAICDFNFFNEDCFLNNEEEAAAAGQSNTSELHAISSTVETGDVKPSCSNQVAFTSRSCDTQLNTMRPLSESHAELEQQQHVLTRKIDFLLRRMRKFQARQMCKHATEEIAGTFEWAARTSNKAQTPVRSNKLNDHQATVMSIVSGRPSSKFWQEQQRQSLPATQMSTVLRHIENAARQQQVSHTVGSASGSLAPSSTWYTNSALPGKRPRKHPDGLVGNVAQQQTDILVPRNDEIVPAFDEYVTSELTHVSGMLHTEMREVQNAIDSDATESSSGGESADEMVNYNNSQQLPLSISRRAVWRYSRDRAAIALRWSWLCSQLSDLDIKIRQHNDLYNELTRTKGAVVLEPTQTASTSSTKSGTLPAAANGYRSMGMQQQSADETTDDMMCSRTRPLSVSLFRKRKLFQTTNMHTISKKAARPSNIKCGCQWPQVPCALCTGRVDPTAPRELPETLLPQNRAALLDPGYHPLLSFPNDVCQSVHIEAIGRQPDWQYRVMRCQAKAIVKGVMKAEREALAASGVGGAGRRPGETGKRRYVRRKERTSNNNNGTKNAKDNNNTINNNNTSQNQTNASIVGGGDNTAADSSGNGTGTATTTSSSTPTTTPLMANTQTAVKHPIAAITTPSSASIGSSNSISPLHASHPHRLNISRQQQNSNSNNQSSLISSKGNGGATKQTRNSAGTAAAAAGGASAPMAVKNNSIAQQHSAAFNSSNTHQNIHNSQLLNGDNSALAETQPWERIASPTHATGSDSKRPERSADRRSRMIYDIDNIVIPYSIAAATRVEILPYKEIPTPKWRVVDNKKEKQEDSVRRNSKEKEVAAPAATTSISELKSNGCATQAEQQQLDSKTAKLTDEKDCENIKAKPTVKVNGSRVPLNADQQVTQGKPVENATSPKEQLHKHNNNNTLVNGDGLLAAAEQKESTKKVEAKHMETTMAKADLQMKTEMETDKQEKLDEPGVAASVVGDAKDTKNNNNEVKEKMPAMDEQSETKDQQPNEANKGVVPRKRKSKKGTQGNISAAVSTSSLTAESNADDTGDEEEDISDEAYIERHQLAQMEERRRFETYLNFPWTTRSRANRRADSRAESSGANTPDPTSPAPHLASNFSGAGTGDYESIPSPLAQQNQQNPLNGLPNNDTAASGKSKSGSKARKERRRTTSSKLKDKECERRSATPDVREQRPPIFEPLVFPLSEEVYQKMLAEKYAEPKSTSLKRAKAKSISSNCDGSYSASGGSRRSSKTKASGTISKLATPHINGDDEHNLRQQRRSGGQHQQEDESIMDYEDQLAEEQLLLDGDDYPKHHLAPLDDEPEEEMSQNETDALYDAYIGENGLDEGDDPFMDDDPNDPEWKRSLSVRHERMRKRI